jgi:hypothetical protein
MFKKIKFIIQLIVVVAAILGALWYLTNQFTLIEAKLNQAVSKDIPKIKSTLEKNSEKTDTIKANMDTITQKITNLGNQAESVNKIETNIDLLTQQIDDNLIAEINQFKKKSELSTKEIKILSQKIDSLTRQYVKFLKLTKDKIIDSVPPKWVDQLPYRNAMIYAIGISPSAKELKKAQKLAVEQARSNMAMMLERKTINAIEHTIESVSKPSPKGLEKLSEEFKDQIDEAINEFLADSRVESYWIDPAGYVYALVSLPVENRIEGSKLGILIETLRLAQLSITEALMQDYKRRLKLELLK